MFYVKRWIMADPHFSHERTVKERGFSNSKDHDDFIINNINSLVMKDDILIIAGDICMNRRTIPILSRINCKNIKIIAGNHDEHPLECYLPYIKDFKSYMILKKNRVIISHIPIHPACFKSRYDFNIHGHTHEKKMNDSRYKCVSLDQTDFYPVLLDDLLSDKSFLNISLTQKFVNRLVKFLVGER